MELSPAAGKILGMLMAYAVSSLGMLLAYVNYRRRIIKADTIFTPAARAIIIGVITVAVIGAILTATAATSGAGGSARRSQKTCSVWPCRPSSSWYRSR